MHVAKFLPAAGPPIYSASGLIGIVERGEALVKVLKDSTAVLMRAHGDAVVGGTLEQAILRTIQLAFLGELAHMAVAHGEPLHDRRGISNFRRRPSFSGTPMAIRLEPSAGTPLALTA